MAMAEANRKDLNIVYCTEIYVTTGWDGFGINQHSNASKMDLDPTFVFSYSLS